VNTPLLRCQDVSKTFRASQQKLEVLNNIEFHIYSGETILLFGKSGQGKSVLLSMLCGLDSPTHGDIYFNGVYLSSCTLKQLETIRRTQIGIVFQNLNLIPSWTAVENVEAALEDILASPRIIVFPVNLCLFNGRQRRMLMVFILNCQFLKDI